MPRKCKTCQRPDVDAINYDLTHNITVRNIMAKYKGLSLGGLDRHADCITALFDEVRAVKRAGLLASVDEVRVEIVAVRAEFLDNPNVRVGLIGKMLDAIEKEAKLTGAYIKEAANPADAKQIARNIITDFLAKGKDPAEVLKWAIGHYTQPDYGILEADIVEMFESVKA